MSINNIVSKIDTAGGALAVSAGVLNIATNGAQYSQIQQVGASRLLGNATDSSASPAEIPLISANLDFNTGSLQVSQKLSALTYFILTGTEIQGMYSAPVTLLPTLSAVATNTHYVITQCVFSIVGGTAPFAAGGDVYLQYGSTAHSSNSDASQRLPAATWIAASAPEAAFEISAAGGGSTDAGNLTSLYTQNTAGVYLSNATQAFTGGADALIIIALQYYIYVAPV